MTHHRRGPVAYGKVMSRYTDNARARSSSDTDAMIWEPAIKTFESTTQDLTTAEFKNTPQAIQMRDNPQDFGEVVSNDKSVKDADTTFVKAQEQSTPRRLFGAFGSSLARLQDMVWGEIAVSASDKSPSPGNAARKLVATANAESKSTALAPVQLRQQHIDQSQASIDLAPKCHGKVSPDHHISKNNGDMRTVCSQFAPFTPDAKPRQRLAIPAERPVALSFGTRSMRSSVGNDKVPRIYPSENMSTRRNDNSQHANMSKAFLATMTLEPEIPRSILRRRTLFNRSERRSSRSPTHLHKQRRKSVSFAASPNTGRLTTHTKCFVIGQPIDFPLIDMSPSLKSETTMSPYMQSLLQSQLQVHEHAGSQDEINDDARWFSGPGASVSYLKGNGMPTRLSASLRRASQSDTSPDYLHKMAYANPSLSRIISSNTAITSSQVARIAHSISTTTISSDDQCIPVADNATNGVPVIDRSISSGSLSRVSGMAAASRVKRARGSHTTLTTRPRDQAAINKHGHEQYSGSGSWALNERGACCDHGLASDGNHVAAEEETGQSQGATVTVDSEQHQVSQQSLQLSVWNLDPRREYRPRRVRRLPSTRPHVLHRLDRQHSPEDIDASATSDPTEPASHNSTSQDATSATSTAQTDSAFTLDALERLEISNRFTIRRARENKENRARADVESSINAAAQLVADQANYLAEQAAKEEVLRRARAIRLGPRARPSHPVLSRLSTESKQRVRDALAKGPHTQVAMTASGNAISRRDIGKVLPQANTADDPSGWLNDEIISAYLQLVITHAHSHPPPSPSPTVTSPAGSSRPRRNETPRYHAFSPFFFTNLSTKGYSSVARWARRAKIPGPSLLQCEYIFIPVNKANSHWTLLVISGIRKTIQYYDSMHGSSSRPLAAARDWLRGELGSDLPVPEDRYVEDDWLVIEEDEYLGRGGGPSQDNASDCGVFLCTSAMLLAAGIEPRCVGARDMPLQRRRIVAEVLNGALLRE